MNETRTKWITAVFVVLGLVGWITVVVWLSSEPTHDLYEKTDVDTSHEDPDLGLYEKNGEIRCASVLSGPVLDPADREAVLAAEDEAPSDGDVVVEDFEATERDNWVSDTCDRLRQRQIGWAMGVGLPSTVILTLGFGRIRWDWDSWDWR